MIHNALSDTILLLAIAVIAVVIFRRIHLPPVLAYLIAGIVLGPYATALVSNTETIHFLAELGVTFLLFSLGLEFSLPKLIANRKAVMGLGSTQVTLSILVAGGLCWLLGFNIETAFVLGCVLALSSTAIVVKQLSEQLELDSRHGRLSIAILLFQDIAVVPMLVIIPTLGGNGHEIFLLQLLLSFAEGLAVIIIMLAIGHWLLRPLFREIARAHSAELFTLTVLLIALTSAWLTHFAGLSMALGAFLAGMMLSETEFRHQIEADIRPFRDILLGLFFITIGMLLDIANLGAIIHWVLLMTLGIVLGKTLITMLSSMLIMRASEGVAFRTGFVLAQGGEFGFALLSLALAANIMEPQLSQILLASVIFSMMITPFLIRYNGHITKSLFAGTYGKNRQQMEQDIADKASHLNKHIIICGFGRIGQNLANVIRQEDFDYFALDYNINIITEARKAGYSVYFGDTTHPEILLSAGIKRATAMVICHDDIRSIEATLKQARELNPEIPILIRTQDDSYYESLQKAGATEIVPETLEASLIMASQLLSLMGIPMARIVRRVQELRNDNYSTLRQFFHGNEADDLSKPEETRKRLTSITLPQNAFALGKTLDELELTKAGVEIHTDHRQNVNTHEISYNTHLEAGDVLVLFGTPECLEHAEAILLNGHG